VKKERSKNASTDRGFRFVRALLSSACAGLCCAQVHTVQSEQLAPDKGQIRGQLRRE
jgi:hypothetical protein